MISKTCGGCKKQLPVEQFHKNKRTSSGLQCYCKECRNAEHKKSNWWAKSLKRNYGLTTEEYNKKAESQGGVCAICGSKDSRRLSTDHNHGTGQVRGLLCRHCNLIIGHAQESESLLLNAVEYLRSWKSK